jgi:photosystem II stability/assembly factor-like uncharacterized protein
MNLRCLIRRSWSLPFLLLLALTAELPARAAERWVPIGPEGGTINALAIDPASPATIYAGSGDIYGGAGVWKSTDGGGTWSHTGLATGTVIALAIDPREPSTVYASTGLLWKSADAGASWTVLPGLPADTPATADAPVTTVAVSPRDSSVFAGTSRGVFKSADGGATWALLGGGLPQSGEAFGLTVDPAHPAVVYVGNTNACAIYKSVDSGATWVPKRSGLGCHTLSAFALDPSASNTLYASVFTGGVFKSINGAESWMPTGGGFPAGSTVQALAVAPGSSSVYAGSTAGLFQSTDAGRTWTRRGVAGWSVLALAVPPKSPSAVYAGLLNLGVFASSNGGHTFKERNHGLVATSVSFLALGPGQPSVLYAASPRGGAIWKTADGGASWQSAAPGSALTPEPDSLTALAVSPVSSAVLYAGFAYGIAQSIDGGLTWRNRSRSSIIDEQIDVIAVDPQNSATIYAAGHSVSAQPDSGCIAFKSFDFIKHWSCLGEGFITRMNALLVIDPVDPKTLYFSAGSFFKSTDGGLTWHTPDPGQPQDFSSLAVDPAHHTTLFADSLSDAWKSTDGGVTWFSIGAGLPHGILGQLAIDRRDGSAVYVTLASFNAQGIDLPGQVFRSRDGGATWSLVGGKLPVPISPQSPAPLVVDPRHRGALYLGTPGHGVYKIVS